MLKLGFLQLGTGNSAEIYGFRQEDSVFSCLKVSSSDRNLPIRSALLHFGRIEESDGKFRGLESYLLRYFGRIESGIEALN